MKKLVSIALGLVLSGVALAAEAGNVTVPELKKAIEEKKVTIIDVNGTESYKAGHIPTAIDFAASGDKISKSLPSDKAALIVAYCGGPQCNAYKAAVKKAQELGYTNVKHLPAGISGWKEAGEKTETVTK